MLVLNPETVLIIHFKTLNLSQLLIEMASAAAALLSAHSNAHHGTLLHRVELVLAQCRPTYTLATGDPDLITGLITRVAPDTAITQPPARP